MTTTFHDREQAFQAKFAHDEEFRFLATARRDKLFARWAAAEMKLSNESGELLVKAVLAIPDGPGHDQALLRYIAGLLSTRDHALREGSLSAALDYCAGHARKQLIEMPAGHSDAPSEAASMSMDQSDRPGSCRRKPVIRARKAGKGGS